MFRHYLNTALRSFWRFRASTLVNVIGLALGMACFVAAYGAITFLRSGDAHFPNADRIVMVTERRTSQEQTIDTGFISSTSEALAASLRNEFPELEAVAQFQPIGVQQVVAGENRQLILAYAAEPDYLRIFDFARMQTGRGNPLAQPHAAVLSEQVAKQLFGTTDVLGRTLTLQNVLDVTVTAVLEEVPQPTHLKNIGLLISQETRSALQLRLTGAPQPARPLSVQWGLSLGISTYALLPPATGLTARDLQARLVGFAERHGATDNVKREFRVVPVTDVRLAEIDQRFFPGEGWTLTRVLLLVAGLVLGLACLNYANSAVAQNLLRAKEVGLRRVVGAKRTQLAAQSIVEAACQVAVATALAVVLVALLGVAIQARTDVNLLGAVAASARFWSAIVLVSLCITGAIGSYPAFALATIRPSDAMRANALLAGRGIGMRILVGAQFAITSTLLVVLLVVASQNSRLRAIALEPDADPQVVLGAGWRLGGASIETWRRELLKSPAIKSVSATTNRPWTGDFGFFSLSLQAGTRSLNPIPAAVYYDFERALDIEIIAGRGFHREFGDVELPLRRAPSAGVDPSAPASIVVDRNLARQLGFLDPGDAVGKVITRADNGGAVKIIGVSEHKPMRVAPFMNRTAHAYVLSSSLASWPVIRISKEQLADGLKAVDETWKRLASMTPVDRRFSNDYFEEAYRTYGAVSAVLSSMTIIAGAIALMGVFGMAIFVAKRRNHEIGVRKTLGASVGQIVALLLRDLSKPVAIANIVAWPLAFVAAQLYLALFIQRIPLSPAPFLASLAATLLVAWLAVGGQAWRAARVQPATVLRYE